MVYRSHQVCRPTPQIHPRGNLQQLTSFSGLCGHFRGRQKLQSWSLLNTNSHRPVPLFWLSPPPGTQTRGHQNSTQPCGQYTLPNRRKGNGQTCWDLLLEPAAFPTGPSLKSTKRTSTGCLKEPGKTQSTKGKTKEDLLQTWHSTALPTRNYAQTKTGAPKGQNHKRETK